MASPLAPQSNPTPQLGPPPPPPPPSPALGIHRISDERVKYSTAVYVEPLGASFVCCMWVYVAAVRG